MGLQSIVSYPERGKFGDSHYRGNCSGYLIMDLLNYFKPRKFVEIFAGGRTGKDVAKQLGIKNSEHLDLNPAFGGWDALKDEMPVGSDFIFAHPPYHDIVRYSGNQWGTSPHPDDLSQCATYEEFIKKLDLVNAKMYSSLISGGRMAILVGDIRKKGMYYSIMKDMLWIGDLESHIIKAQHNVVSNTTQYSGHFIPIIHEHLLIFKKNQLFIIPIEITKKVTKSIFDSLLPTWRDLVQAALESLGGKGSLKEIYNIVKASVKTQKNLHWEEQVRKVLQLNRQFVASQGRGVWALNLD